jgi:hypothetical protein
LRLHRALYGLKQAAHAWHAELLKALTDIGFTQSVVDPAAFVRRAVSGVCIIFSHVDDLAGTGPPGEITSDYIW